jgi:hypothetical protein
MKKSKQQMIQDILINAKANNVITDGDLFFALAFRTETELKKICQEMNIK